MDSNEILKSRMADLSGRAYERNYHTFSEFLNTEEISILNSLKLPCDYRLYGGYTGAERCVAGFGAFEDCFDFPITYLKIAPIQQKFSDALTHRDFLGALMNLGINRNTLGDIIISDNVGYLVCLNSISNYIVEHLTRIRHTVVSCEQCDTLPDMVTKLPEPTEIIVTSLRADAVVASVYKMSRNKTSLLFSQNKIFINSKLCVKEAQQIREGDMISVRGCGRFLFEAIVRNTKKERLVISVRVFR